jgi:putative glutamine amidotransferase
VTRAPVIGVAGALERARWSVWDLEAVLVPRNYLDAIAAAGGVPLIIPPLDAVDAAAALERVDALLLVGGADVDPGSYGAEAHELTVGSVPERDRAETELVRVAWDRDLPFLGICRGMQVLNVARGGDLRQHLPDDVGHEEHRRVIGTFDNADHDVTLAEGSLAARAAGETEHGTKSHHHQGVKRIGEGLEVTGWAVGDELPEAVEAPDRTWVLGVQWHPEADETSRVIGALVEEVRAAAQAASVNAASD